MLLNNQKYWFHRILHILYNYNHRLISTITALRDIQNVQRAHSNVDWTRNTCQPMALITEIIGKDKFKNGEVKRQPEKPQFIMAMQKEIYEHKKHKHWKLVHRFDTKGEKLLWQLGPIGEKGTTSLER